MNRTITTVIAVILIAVIVFSAVSISQDLLKKVRFDVTDQKLYSLSDGTRAILARLNQPIKMKLFYTRTAAMKARDQIRFFNNYAYFVETLLNEYATQSKGMVQLEVIDPRPFSDEEADALRYGLQRIPMSEEEGFIFGLVLQTQFGVAKTIPFFSPDRENFVEYDISYLIDTAVRRQKKIVGVISSLPVMGEDVSGYMAQMMAIQGRQPQGPWTVIKQLRTKYEVKKIETDTDTIEGIDLLLIVHPKNFSQKTLFAIDQFILKGGRVIAFIDPYCYVDQPQQQMPMAQANQTSSSNLEPLMKNWGLKMRDMTFAGDRKFALTAPLGPQQRPAKIIGLLGITSEGFNQDSVITAELNQVRLIFAGAFEKTTIPESDETKVEQTPLMSTTARGNTWSVDSQYELMMPDPSHLMNKFFDGTEPIHMGYLVTGKFASAFPDGIMVKNESDPNAEPNLVTGLTVANDDCAVILFSDVDFITDQLAYQTTFFGRVPIADNAALLLNAVDDLGGSADLISIRSRGNFRREFTVVKEIETEAEKSTAQEEAAINAEIQSFQQELNRILATAKQGEEEVIGSTILQKRKQIEYKIHEARARLRDVKMKKREKIEHLGNRLRNLNTLPGPIIMVIVAIILGIYRSTKKRHYVSHASDA